MLESIKTLAEEFVACRKTLLALGDENRQHLILEMMQMGNCKTIDDEVLKALQTEIETCNQESGLSIQLITNEPKAFDSFMAHYGKFQRRDKLYCADRKEK